MSPSTDRCNACVVRDRALCSSLSDEELTVLADIGRRREIPKGQVIAWEGDRANMCATLVSGVLKLTSATPDGREAIVGLLYPGDFVGELFVDEVHLTVTAACDADLCFYARDRFEAVLDRHVALERLLLRRTIDSLADARARMLVLGRRTAEEKVASLLLELSRRLAPVDDAPAEFTLPLARGEMADLLGLTIETVSRQLTRLKADGIISLTGLRGVTVLDRNRLARIVSASG